MIQIPFFRLLGSCLVLMLVLTAPARAGLSILRDADVEYGLRKLAAPVLSAAGLNPNRIKMILIDDSALNAFVADTSHIFINYGLIMKLDSAAQLQAVIAHEAAHIANGHIGRRLDNMRTARTAAGLGLILGAAAGVASRNAEAGFGVAMGAQSSAIRLFLSHTRSEESSADIASVRYLLRAGIDPTGAVEVQDLFRGQEALSVGRQDPYMRTHPLSRERYRALKGLVAGHQTGQKNPGADYWFNRIKGKITAFKRAPNWTLRRSKDSASQDIALMRQAAAWHRQSNLKKALGAIDGAIKLRPNDPYLRDLKGQILLESRQFGSAVQVYSSAAKMAPNDALILGGLGRAMLANGQPKRALPVLERARSRDFSDPRLLRDLAVAYAQTKQNGMASLVTAERYALLGRFKDAALHAKRAEGLLPRGSGPWQRAQDVLTAAKRAPRR
ncbi:M48 family metalloprotease [Pacificoceanicola onchidii]|uniref:M48 family metalloprotease n=1 Tax=Pacificoceanicola onchidii TaxID=2562685 RepID=UPI0010A55E27|nr:M48 family metalloprotease [Pacificoceanicola onchidii]